MVHERLYSILMLAGTDRTLFQPSQLISLSLSGRSPCLIQSTFCKTLYFRRAQVHGSNIRKTASFLLSVLAFISYNQKLLPEMVLSLNFLLPLFNYQTIKKSCLISCFQLFQINFINRDGLRGSLSPCQRFDTISKGENRGIKGKMQGDFGAVNLFKFEFLEIKNLRYPEYDTDFSMLRWLMGWDYKIGKFGGSSRKVVELIRVYCLNDMSFR